MLTNPIQARLIAGVHCGGDLHRILTQVRPDIIHAHGLWLCASAQNHEWCKRKGVPYLISPHGMLDSWAVKNSAWKKRIAGLWFEYAHLNDASCLHALNPSEAIAIRKFGQPNPICVIPNGIDLPLESERIVESPWKRGDGRRALAFIGRLHPKKGLPLLITAWAALKAEAPELTDSWFLAIAGWSEVGHREELEAQVEEFGIERDVEFLGPVQGDVKNAVLQHASAFVLPSYSEDLPMSILEAWAYKLPVLMTPECNLPEGFEAGAALHCDTWMGSVGGGLRRLLEMTDGDRELMGRRGFELVQSKFVWSQIAKQLLSVYEWILGGGDAPVCVQLDK